VFPSDSTTWPQGALCLLHTYPGHEVRCVSIRQLNVATRCVVFASYIPWSRGALCFHQTAQPGRKVHCACITHHTLVTRYGACASYTQPGHKVRCVCFTHTLVTRCVVFPSDSTTWPQSALCLHHTAHPGHMVCCVQFTNKLRRACITQHTLGTKCGTSASHNTTRP